MKKILLSLLFPLALFAEEQTTGNLITNGTFNNGTTGWTLSGNAQRIGDCCPGGHDLEFGDSGSIEQSFDLSSETITQPMLNNGITLNSSVEVQNGECAVSGCWGGSGGADTFTIRLQIKDSDSNVLATTTQERTNVTGINGEDFTDTLSYTGSGSNIGNIFISGSDANSPATLGGPNVDNISVTMTYDDEVLTATQTAIIATAFEEIEEVLATEIETVEFEPLQELVFEVFEEPEMIVELFEEIYLVPTATEEINTGIVNIFFEAIETEEIEIAELPTIENFEETAIVITEEPSIFEETVELIEEMFEEIPIEENVETSTTEGSVEESSFQEEVADDTQTEQEVATVVEEEETVATGNETISETSEGNETAGTDDGTLSSESGEGSNEESIQEVSTGEEVVTDNNQREVSANISIDVADISEKVAQKIKDVDKQLQATQMIVAKVMQNNDAINTYSQINNQIFNNQVIIDGGNVDEYMQRTYLDTRVLYAESSIDYKDSLQLYQDRIDEAVANRIRAEEHLRRIRGF